jgi:rod shape determining protein RodA
MKINKKVFSRINYSIIFSMIIISIFGIITISYATLANTSGSIKTTVYQIIWLIVSCIAGFIILLIDYNSIGDHYKIFYVVSNILLVLVLVVGSNRKGHKSWLGIGQLGIVLISLENLKISLACTLL